MELRNIKLLKFVGIFLLISTVAYAAAVGSIPKHIVFNGLNTEAGPLSLKDGESPDCMNTHTSIFGTLVKRAGYAKQSYSHTHVSTSTGKCNGIFDYAVDTDTRKIIAMFDSRIYEANTTDDGWKYLAPATTLTDDIAEFENLDGTLLVTTWSRNLTQSWNGTADTMSNVTDMPQGRHIIQAYTRIFVSNIDVGGTIYPLRFYFSNPGSYTTWTTASDYETLDASQGDEAMGWGLLKGRLFGFTKYTVNLISDVGGSSPMNVTKRIDGIGLGAPRTVKTVHLPSLGESLIWLSQDKKLYAWNGSTLTELSLKIHKNNNLSKVYMENITESNLKYCHAQVDKDKGWYILWIPITTNIDYGVIYDYNTNSLWPISNQNFWSSAPVETSTGTKIYVGERDGQFHLWNSGTDDDGVAINSWWLSRRWDFGFMPAIKKMGEVQLVTKTLGNYDMSYQYRYNFDNNWSTAKTISMLTRGDWLLGGTLPATLGGHEAQVHRLTIPGKFNLFQVKLSENSSNPAWEVYGLDLATNATGSIGD